VIRCEACGHENPETNRFCGECAASLVAAEPGSEVRKTVTVVFCDVVGSTAMGEALDPELVRHVMERYFEAMQATIQHHGGMVEKFIGDAVMAIFGVPHLHEDDAVRAVRAAADMRVALAALNADLDRDYGTTLACRIGVNTGEVVAGAGDRAIVTGDSVNVAARLEQAAAPGDILMGEETYRLVRDAVIAEPVAALDLKGKTDPVPAHRLVEVTPGAAGFSRHLDAPIVGRVRELSLLRGAFDRVVADQACQLFTVFGVGGVGKSRLLAAFVEELGDRAIVLRGRCLPYGEGITFYPLAEALIDIANLNTAEPEAARAKLAELVGSDERAERIAERVGQAIGIPGSQTAPEETLWAVRVLLERLAAELPVVFMIDDLQWAEPMFLELIEHVADFAQGAPILLVCMARPELLDDKPGWSKGKLNAISIPLEPLGPQECGTLVANLLADDTVDEGVRMRIVEAAEGNPLQAEEITGLLVDEGRLVLDEGRWVATGELSDVPVPPTISALLAARLEKLPPLERRLLEIASVMGQVFYLGAVHELANGDPASVDIGLDSLVGKQFVRPERSDLPPTRALAFRHLLIRDAAYQSMPKQQRSHLHEHFADWLDREAADQVAEQREEIVGHHLEQAWRYRQELGPMGQAGVELGARAGANLGSAGLKAADRGDLRASTNLLGRAVALIPVDSIRRLDLLVIRGSQLLRLGALQEADEVLTEAIERAQKAGEKATEWLARVERAYTQIHLHPEGQTEAARSIAGRAIPILDRLGDDAGLARAWELMVVVHWMAARAGAAKDAAEQGLVHAKRTGDSQTQTRLLQWMISFDADGPTAVEEGLRLSEEILADAAGNRILMVDALLAKGLCLAQLGRFTEARAMIQEGQAILDDLGLRGTLDDFSSWELGKIESLALDFGAAERSLMGQYGSFKEMDERNHLSTVAGEISRVMCDQGRFDEGERFARICQESAASDDISSQILWRSSRARVLARRGDPEGAESLAREAVAISMRTDFIGVQADARMDLSDVLRAIGRPDESRPVAEEALELYRRKGNLSMVRRTEATLMKL
jgi:class 3 adenylate cyclase/tetratricopeptide (TPR) repeat protein